MKEKEKNRRVFIIALIFVFLVWVFRKRETPQQPETITRTNARAVADWPFQPDPEDPEEPNICSDPPVVSEIVEFTGDVLKVHIAGNSGTIRVDILDEDSFDVLFTQDVAHIPDSVHTFNLPGLAPGGYIVRVISVYCEGPESSLLAYIEEEEEPEEPTIITEKPAWVGRADITRQASTGDTSVWVDPSGLELQVSRTSGNPQPTGLDHNNQPWNSETWQAGDSQWSGDYSKVYRLNPVSAGNGGLLQGVTYNFDFRRITDPLTIYRIQYTVPAGDLSYISLLPGTTPPDPPEELDQLSGIQYIQSPDGTRKLEIIGSRRVKLAISNSGVITDTYHEDTESDGRRTAEMFPGLFNIYYVIGADIYDLISEIVLPPGLYYIDKIYARASKFPTKVSVVNNIIGLTPENDDCFDIANIILKVV